MDKINLPSSIGLYLKYHMAEQVHGT